MHLRKFSSQEFVALKTFHEKQFNFTSFFQLSGINSENIQLKACLSHGKRLIPTLAAHFDPYSSDYPIPPPPPRGGQGSEAREEDREEASLCPGGRLLRLNVSAAERVPSFARVMVPYPKDGDWFLTLLPACSKINIRRENQET